jgi:hypothetical protein
MSTESEGKPDGAPLVTRRTMEIVVALLLLAAAAVVIADSIRLGIGWRPNEGPTAGYFPFYIGLILAVSSAVNLLRAVAEHKGGGGAFVTRPAFRRVLAVLLPLAVYVAAVTFIGIYVSSAIYIALFMWYFGKYRLVVGAPVGVAIAGTFFLMFEIWFLVPLPKGPLENYLGF